MITGVISFNMLHYSLRIVSKNDEMFQKGRREILHELSQEFQHGLTALQICLQTMSKGGNPRWPSKKYRT